jgi:hypothetical protein
VARQVFRRGEPLRRATGAGEEAEHVRDRRQLVGQHGVERFAGIARFERGVVRRLGVDVLGNVQQQRRALLGSGACPAGEGVLGRHHRSIHLRH